MSWTEAPASQWYLNRELSWLEFNERVLQEGLSPEVPLLERLKFLAIVSSNLDEFFMIRVAGLKQQKAAGITNPDPSGLTPEEQLKLISQRTHRMMQEQAAGIRKAFRELAEHGIVVLQQPDWSPKDEEYLAEYFRCEILPVLTPLAIEQLNPCPLLPGLQLNVALLLCAKRQADECGETRIAVIPVPSQFDRFVRIPAEGQIRLALLEDVIARHAGQLFPGLEVLSTAVFRITRDADVPIEDEDAEDLLQVVERAVLARRRRAPVRLALSSGCDRRLKDWLTGWLQLEEEDVYEIPGMLDATALTEIVALPGFESLRYPDWPPQTPADLLDSDDIWTTVEDHDVMLFHPYESFEPVVKLLQQAAEDPNVLAIKQTLYRTSGDSPIVAALAHAAENGKEVTVLVELKARFDEARNVQWARRLEDAGCHVIYGIAGLKTHAKALLIVRRSGGRIRRYVHLSTGNYNDRTARIYSDIGIITTNPDICSDVAALFNLLTGYSEAVGWAQLTVEPRQLRQRFIDLIEREIQLATPEAPGLIMAKANALQDPEICKALIRASQAGVQIRLNIRGICCLRPGVAGLTENIEVRSIVDRFLEHARIFYFRNGGHEEVYLSSADWMYRNLDRRVEILVPVLDQRLRRRLIKTLEIYFADNVKAWELGPDGQYRRVKREGRPIRAQEYFYNEAVEAVRAAETSPMRFRPLRRPE